MGATYVVAEGPDGMYLLDQHAAHERVVYDRLLARDPSAPAGQPLLDPLLIEFDALQAATLDEHRDHLATLGLEVEPFGERSYLVRMVPSGLGSTDVAAALRALVADLAVTTAPRTCPHGRPTLIHVSTDLLERQFGRR
jgi:DNA mismatch repair protein MutL